MATSDAKKREENIKNSVLRAPSVGVDVMLQIIARVWERYGWPKEEKDAARRWAGTIERLYNHCADYDAAVLDKRSRWSPYITPLSGDTVAAIENAARLKVGTPLDLARHFGIPLEVVLYVADGSPKIDTMQRPWLRNNRRNY